MRREFSDPNKMLIALEYIGKKETTTKELYEYLKTFTNPDKDETFKSRAGATNDVLFNIKDVLFLVEEKQHKLSLSHSIPDEFGFLFSGKQIFADLLANDKEGAFKKLQMNCLFMYPEMRSLISFIYKKNDASKSEIGNHHLKKCFFEHTFNLFTIDAELKQAKLLNLVDSIDGKYKVNSLKTPIFAQLLIEEYVAHRESDNTVSMNELKDLLDLKYGMTYQDFDNHFSSLSLLIPDLFIFGTYGKFQINLEFARKVKLYE
ncbi:hypothetical protein ACSAZK_17495 [Methanosarcina sp. Mfa9]|uniref:hypothetical protein n=1 Tax=Methanosarcina sp. Mfa9 TaxID=3439063 RepID=UPI003F86DBDB